MGPFVPEEINVFSVPHSRMKELVDGYFDLIRSTNFSNTVDLELLLESLYSTFTEFKIHEQIENKLIVRRLRSKMRNLSVNNMAVCNCHKGSKLTAMLKLLEDGFNKITDQDRINYGIKLQKELMEFTNDSFIPHMKEEEELFQPLLLKYFSYKELHNLKEKVIKKHLAEKDIQRNGFEKAALDDIETEEGSSSSEEESKVCVESRSQKSVTVKCYIMDLPPELILKVFQYLSPQELCRCALLCHRLNQLAMDHSLWKSILPVQWSRGHFSFYEVYFGNNDLDGSGYRDTQKDDDADSDECEYVASDLSRDLAFFEEKVINDVVTYLLPKVGCTVEKLVLAYSRKITDKLVRKFLVLCPNVKYIDLSQTKVSDAALVSFGQKGYVSHLSTLILSGCSKITDASLINLALCLKRSWHCQSEDFEDFSMQRFVLCSQYLKMHQGHAGQSCKYALKKCDMSRCQLKLFCNSSTLNLDGNLTQKTGNYLNSINGFFDDTKKVTSCNALDSCDQFEMHCNGDIVRQVQLMKNSHDTSVDNGRQNHHKVFFSEHHEQTLETLDLSGCFRITDVGLSALFRGSCFPFLRYLDLSGCMQVTAVGLNAAVAASQSLDPSSLFYCDSITDGPFASEASGCRNLECNERVCCSSGSWYEQL